jgi:predicted glutamine amidotransferase
MCIGIIVPPGKSVSRKRLKRCSECHSDGMGYSFVDNNGNVIVRRYLESFNRFHSDLNRDWRRYKDSNFLVHFRKVSAGKRSLENVHPHFVPGHNMSFIHNGTIFDLKRFGEDRSDTVILGEEILAGLGSGFLGNKSILYLLESLTKSSRLAFLTGSNEVTILHAKEWHEDEGVLYSNTSYRDQPASVCLTPHSRNSTSYSKSSAAEPKYNIVSEKETAVDYEEDDKYCSICNADKVRVRWRPTYEKDVYARTCRNCATIPENLRIPSHKRRSDSQQKVIGAKWHCSDCKKFFWDMSRQSVDPKWEATCMVCGPKVRCTKIEPMADMCNLNCGYEIRHRADQVWFDEQGICAECGIWCYSWTADSKAARAEVTVTQEEIDQARESLEIDYTKP